MRFNAIYCMQAAISRSCHNRIPQHHPTNSNFRASRGLDGFRNLKLHTDGEDNSDIGTRKMGKNAPDVQW